MKGKQMTDIEQPAITAIDPDIEKYKKEYADKSAEELRKDIHNSLTKLYTHNLGFDYGLDRQIRIMERILEKKESQQMTTIGEKRVRVKYRPADHSSDVVDEIKQRTAVLINICGDFRIYSPDISREREVNRLAETAMTKYEEAAMWAVKAATVEKE